MRVLLIWYLQTKVMFYFIYQVPKKENNDANQVKKSPIQVKKLNSSNSGQEHS